MQFASHLMWVMMSQSTEKLARLTETQVKQFVVKTELLNQPIHNTNLNLLFKGLRRNENLHIITFLSFRNVRKVERELGIVKHYEFECRKWGSNDQKEWDAH